MKMGRKNYVLYILLSFLIFLDFNVFSALAEQGPDNLIVITTPEHLFVFEEREVEVKGQVDQNIDSLKVFLNGEEWLGDVIINGNDWSFYLEGLVVGEYTIFLTGMDGEGTIYSSNVVMFTIDVTEIVSITMPNKGFTNSTIIEGATTTPNTEVALEINYEELSYELSTTSDNEGFWKIDLIAIDPLVDGEFVLKAKINTIDLLEIETEPKLFTLDRKRPIVSSTTYPQANMTQVDVNTWIAIQIIDEHLKIDDFSEVIAVYREGSVDNIDGTTLYDDETSVLYFEPSEPLEASQKYFVVVNQLIQDKAGNLIFAKNWSFTTKTDNNGGNPHSKSTLNTNSCKNCHSIHAAEDPKNLSVSDLKDTIANQKYNSFCYSCHDGSAASLPHNSSVDMLSVHDKGLVKKDGTIVNDSCGTCHDPHVEWSSHNPNLFKGNYVYQHQNLTSNARCEQCHGLETIDLLENNDVSFEVYTYRTKNTSLYELPITATTFGNAGDYTLCLNCHNEPSSVSYRKVKNIDQYYNDDQSLHFISNDIVPDGSLLDGHMPCAECHSSYSSTNLFLLNEKIGHENPTSFSVTEGWTVAKEREFCMTCHNGNTLVYGITPEYDGAKPIHEDNSSKSCAFCHGGTSKSFIEAVHAPKK